MVKPLKSLFGHGRTRALLSLIVGVVIIGLVMITVIPKHTAGFSSDSLPGAKLRRQLAGRALQRHQMNDIVASPKAIENKNRVLILTPLSKFHPQYWQNILSLSYPRELVDIGFIVPKTREGNQALAQLNQAVNAIQSGPKKKRFSSVTILRQDFDSPISQDEKSRHALKNQLERRGIMARSRNSLVFTTLDAEHSWVLWIDADVVETPASLIEDLTMHDKPVLAPNCYQRYTNDEGKPDIRPYDFNNWVDSEQAQELAKNMGENDILVEGYAELATYRTLMAFLYDANQSKHQEIELDGVGGAVLLVKADVHKDGAMFPPFAFYHLIETEGFAKMARRLNYHCFGLPNYLIYHYNE